MLEKSLFPQLLGKWEPNILLNEYFSLVQKYVKYNPFLEVNLAQEWINLLHKTYGVDYSYGGYLENREQLLTNTYLNPGERIHLGVDYWVPEGTEVFLPVNAQLVYSGHDGDDDGGWGGKLVFHYKDLYFILGHLDNLVTEIGYTYTKCRVGVVAGVDRSGGWIPHLHVQCMRKPDYTVDGYGRWYPGIHEDFPNPEVLAVP